MIYNNIRGTIVRMPVDFVMFFKSRSLWMVLASIAVTVTASSFAKKLFSATRGRMTMSSSSRACFGAGCYWGTEKFIKNDFGLKLKPGSIGSGAVGFMSASPTAKVNPTYREVCGGRTQHVEVYDFEFNGDDATYEALVKHFYMFHDPTTTDRQGNDRGSQYASAIFCYSPKQMEIANKVTAELQELINKGKIARFEGKTVSTAITPAFTFYPAEEDHQAYLDKNPWGYCNHGYRFTQWPSL